MQNSRETPVEVGEMIKQGGEMKAEREGNLKAMLVQVPMEPDTRTALVQKPLPLARQNAKPNQLSASRQTVPAAPQAAGMPARLGPVIKLLWNTILIATVAITWFRVSLEFFYRQ